MATLPSKVGALQELREKLTARIRATVPNARLTKRNPI